MSVFPTVTPVCLSSIATGETPAGHGIPHIAWFDRDQDRVVDYGSSTGAVFAAGPLRVWRDSMVEMTRSHLSPRVETIFEALERAGLVTATVTFTCFRGPVEHQIRIPRLLRRGRWFETVSGPSKFFFFDLYESERIATPLALRSREAGSVDAYGAAVARHLVGTDAFDFFLYYLPDLDYAAHLSGHDGAREALGRVDGHIGALFEAAAGSTPFSSATRSSSPQTMGTRMCTAPFGSRICSSGSSSRSDAREIAARIERSAAADLTLFIESDQAVARRGGEELRFRRAHGSLATNGPSWETSGSSSVLDEQRYPNGLSRAWEALNAPRSGDVLVSAADGWEFRDLGGRDHVGGAGHGSLTAADSVVPLLAAGVPLPAR